MRLSRWHSPKRAKFVPLKVNYSEEQVTRDLLELINSLKLGLDNSGSNFSQTFGNNLTFYYSNLCAYWPTNFIKQ